RFDAARVAAQIVSGVGFLGAGVIFVKNYGVTGLTTAAGIWTTSIVGMAFGAGMYLVGVVTAAFIILFQSLMFPSDIFQRHEQFSTIIESKDSEVISEIDGYMEANNLHRKSYRLKYREDKYTLNFQIFPKDTEELNKFITFLQTDLHVEKFDIF